MFTYKFEGLRREDSQLLHYYGSLPAKPEVGHELRFDQTGNRYRVGRIEGEGLTGPNDHDDQMELAWAEINRGERVPTLFLQLLSSAVAVVPASSTSLNPEALAAPIVQTPTGQSVDEHALLKWRHQRNMKISYAKTAKVGS